MKLGHQMRLFRTVFVSKQGIFVKGFYPKAIVWIFIGVACINPPIPPDEANLQLLYQPDTLIAFGDTVTYICKEGFFFEEDYDMLDFKLTCKTNGNFTEPLPWKKCLNPNSKFKLGNFLFPNFPGYFSTTVNWTFNAFPHSLHPRLLFSVILFRHTFPLHFSVTLFRHTFPSKLEYQL